MQLYKTTYANEDGMPVTTFQASQTEASKKRAEVRKMGFKPETETINVPTSKGPLIEWLNENIQ